jgi:hypothetical protein
MISIITFNLLVVPCMARTQGGRWPFLPQGLFRVARGVLNSSFLFLDDLEHYLQPALHGSNKENDGVICCKVAFEVLEVC